MIFLFGGQISKSKLDIWIQHAKSLLEKTHLCTIIGR